MSELRELYQEYVLDHGKNPRNFRYPEGATHTADGYNPLCGDKITVQVDGDVIADLGFQGQGCAISTASASTMTEAVKGKTLGEARDYFEKFIAMVKGEEEPDLSSDELETLSVFAGVAEFPMRVKCATLAWHTLTAALEGKAEVSTE